MAKRKKRGKGLSVYAYLAGDKKTISKDKHDGVNYPNWPFPVAKDPDPEIKAMLGPLPKAKLKWYEKIRKKNSKPVDEVPLALM